VFEYRDRGYLPEALFNFLGLVGWSLDDKTEIISKAEFIEHFSLDRVVKNPAVFNVEKLQWMNGVYIREVLSADDLVDRVTARLEQDLPQQIARPLDRSLVARVTPLIRERIKLLSEAAAYCDFFFTDELHYTVEDLLGKAYASRPADAKTLLEAATEVARDSKNWNHEDLETALRSVAERVAVKAGDLFSLVRVAVTGRRVTPPLFESMEILGRERCITRLTGAAACL
jgi:glutamyl-tRNA synthetase